MRKRLPVLLTFLLLVFALFFAMSLLSGPGVIAVLKSDAVEINPAAALRVIADTSTWVKWWPGLDKPEKGIYVFDSVRFGPPQLYYNEVRLNTDFAGMKTQSHLFIIPAGTDSVMLNWTDSFPAGGSLLNRWKVRRQADVRSEQLARILHSLRSYLNDPVHVYGFRIIHEISRDSTLISTTFSTQDSPATTLVYGKLDGLKAYIAANKAEIVNYPMIRVDGKPGAYRTMLAYPVNKALPDSAEYKFKRFLPWKMLSAEVHGPEPNVRNSYRQFYQYVQDYNIPVMANGFAFLVTDRRKEPDSTKWVTRLSVPIP